MQDRKGRIEILFQLMEWDYITDAEQNLLTSLNEQFDQTGNLSERQLEILEDINQRANERNWPLRR